MDSKKEAPAVGKGFGKPTDPHSVNTPAAGVKPKPPRPEITALGIPRVLRRKKRWAGWRFEWDPGEAKWKKAPTRLDGRHASSTNPSHWIDFKAALAACEQERFDGLAYVLDEGEFLLDLDECAEAGKLSADSGAALAALSGAYAEWSQSKRGVHVLGLAQGKSQKRGKVELYFGPGGRFAYLTGNHIQGSAAFLAPSQEALDQVRERLLPEPEVEEPAVTSAQPVNLDDRGLPERMFAAKNGEQIRRLWEGDWQGLHPSQSEADLALCDHLAFYVGPDPAVIEQMFRSSGLGNRAKSGRDDYLPRTIAKALAGRTRFYEPAATIVYSPSGSLTSSVTLPPRELEGHSLTHAELLAADFPPPKFLVEDLIELGTLGTIAALPELWKSWLAVELAHKVAAGTGTFLGREIQANGPVGFWWQDDSSGNMAARVEQYAERHGFTNELPIRWNLNRGLVLPRDIDLLREQIEREKQVLTILDSLYNFALGMELKSEEVGALYAKLKTEVCDPTGCTILTIDHAPWPTEGNRGQVRSLGSVFKQAAIRWGIFLGKKNGSVFLQAGGNNVAGLKRQIATFDGDKLEVHLTAIRSSEETARRVAELREENPAITQEQAAEALEMTRRTVGKYWHEDDGQESLLNDE